MSSIQCPCCGYYTLFPMSNDVNNEICEVCFWQYDDTAQMQPNRTIRSNRISLQQAQKNYLQFGACESRFIDFVRQPEPDELPENNRP